VPQTRLLILLSVFTVLLAIGILVWFPTESSAIGSVMEAAAGVLAVIWFPASLFYQSQQLREQREQFQENFRQLREDNRRSALVAVRDVLLRAEERALQRTPDCQSIDGFTVYYTKIPEWDIIEHSTDPNVVCEAAMKWLNTKDIPAIILVRGIKNAAEMYYRATGSKDVDYSMDAESFVVKYGSELWKLPYFEEYTGVADSLANFMVFMKPHRATISLAAYTAVVKNCHNGGMNIAEEDLIERIRAHKKAGYPVPAIAKDLAEEAG